MFTVLERRGVQLDANCAAIYLRPSNVLPQFGIMVCRFEFLLCLCLMYAQEREQEEKGNRNI